MLAPIQMSIVCLLGGILISSKPVYAAEQILNITGWTSLQDLYRKDRPDDFLGDDPIVGRQACPSLVRYSAMTMKPEPVLLKTVPDDQQGSGPWIFALRPSLRWWNGAAVSQGDLAAYLEKELKSELNSRQINIEPRVAVLTNTVEVHWPKAPGFGPMVFAGKPFWRAVVTKDGGNGPKYECTGLYTISSIDGAQDLTMRLSKGYSGKYQSIRLSPNLVPSSAFSIAFTSEGTVAPGSTIIPSRKCNAILDLPFVTALIWNSESKWVSSPAVRQALTQAIPRGEILRTAGADLGSLISGPLLRNHAGYSSSQVVPPSNLEIASNVLTNAGFKQLTIGAQRLAADGSVMRLRILRASKAKQPLLEKIISDSYASIGIETEFLENNGPQDIEKADGALAGVALPWPELNLRTFLHSRPEKRLSAFPFFVPNDKSLDELLESYEISLNSGKPKVDQLIKIHARFADLESWSMIMGHQSCLKTSGLTIKGKLNSADPDWFRRQVLD